MDKQKIYEKLKRASANIRFEEICGYAVDFGFTYKGGKGSHRIFVRKNVREHPNFQNVKGMAKPYQVR